MDTPYVWRCSECGDDFEGSGPGHSAFMKHAIEDHGMKPAQCAGGVVDAHTDEVVLPGCGTQVLMQGRRLGFITENPNKKAVEVDSGDDPDDAPKGKPEKEKPLTPRERLDLAKAEKALNTRGRTVMQDVDIDPEILLVFRLAQREFPDDYKDLSRETLSLFLWDCVMLYGGIAQLVEFPLKVTNKREEPEDDSE